MEWDGSGQSGAASPGLSRVRPSVLAATCAGVAAGLESICLAGSGVFPAGPERPRGAGGSPGPLAHLLPVYFLTLKYHLADKHSPERGGRGHFPASRGRTQPLGCPSPRPQRCPPTGHPAAGGYLASWAGVTAVTPSSGHVPSVPRVPCRVPSAPCPPRTPEPPPGAAHSTPRAVWHGTALPARQPSAQRPVCLAGSAGRAVMPNTTTSWHSLKPAARHRDRQEVCNAAAPGCALCCPADSDPRRSVSGGPGGSGHGDARPVPHACRAAQENPAAAARPPTPAAAASAGSWRLDREPAVFAASRGSRCSPGQDCQLLLSVRPPVSRTWRGRGHTHTRTHTCANLGGSLQQEGVTVGVYVAPCTHRPAASTSTHVHEHACTCTYRHTCATAYTHPYSHYLCTHMHGYTHPCMDAHKCVQLHIHAHACTRMRCPSTHNESSLQVLPCPCPDVCHPPPQQHRPPAPHAWPCPPRNAPGLLGWAPGPDSPPPQPVPVSWWPCVGRPQLSTQPLPSVLPPVRVGGCCGPPQPQPSGMPG